DDDGDRWARTFWVDGQLAFFQRRGPEHDHRAEALESRSLILVMVSVLFAALLFLTDALFLEPTVHGSDQTGQWHHERWLHRAAIFLIGFLPSLAAVWTGYVERLAFKAQARQYDRMRVLFQRAQDLLKSSPAGDFPRIRVLYAELGKEAME